MTEKTAFRQNPAREGADWADDLELALELGALAAEVALPTFHAGVKPKDKPDGSWVTEADLEVERRLIEVIAARRPGDAVLSEESGAIGASERRWILDPIDGTFYFASRRESWGTHVALEVGGELVLGVVTRPVLGEWWWAARGGGAYHGRLGERSAGRRLQVTETAEPERARIMVWSRRDDPIVATLRERQRWLEPTIDGLLDVASGRLDALVDFLGCPWDVAPGVVLVEEAGGRFSDRAGGRRIDAFGGRFTNGRIDSALDDLVPRG